MSWTCLLIVMMGDMKNHLTFLSRWPRAGLPGSNLSGYGHQRSELLTTSLVSRTDIALFLAAVVITEHRFRGV